MVGPVLYQEMMLGSRRNRGYVVRWCYAGWMVLQLGFLFFVQATFARMGTRRPFDYTDFADFARYYLEILVTQHYLVLLLATPVLTAGAITDEKWRGTLQYLLVTELYSWEILVGKLIGRLYQVLLIALTALPLMCFLGVFGGLDPLMLLALMVSTVVLAFALGCMSLLASVLCRHTRDAVLGLYTVGTIAYFGGRLAHWLLQSYAAGKASFWLDWLEAISNCFDPLHPLGTGWTMDAPGERGRRLLASVLAWGLLGLSCLVLATWRLRGSYLRYLESSGKEKKRHWWLARRKPVHGDPLRWKERHVEGVAPLAALRRLPRWLGIVLVVVATTISSGYILSNHLPIPLRQVGQLVRDGDLQGLVAVHQGMSKSSNDFYYQGVVVMLLAGLVIAIRCSGAVTGEREKNTWEALLLTPLETRQLIRSKLWGIIGASFPYLLAYALPALAFAAVGGVAPVLWTLLWLGVTLLGMGFVGATGLWCSVRSKSSWRSLLGTLGVTYIGGFILFCVTSPIIWIVAMLIALAIMIADSVCEQQLGSGFLPPGKNGMTALTTMFDVFGVALCLTLAGTFVFIAWRFIVSAEYRVSILERTKHWKDEPKHPRWSRYGRERRRRRAYDD